MERVKVMRPSLYDLLGPLDVPGEWFTPEMEGEAAARDSLVEQLRAEVRGRADALGCSEVVVPQDLIQLVTASVLTLADSEPCGLRGGVLHVQYCDDQMSQGLTRVVLDPSMPNTFELYLTLGPDTSTWYHKMSRLIKPLRRSSPLLLSTNFRLVKKKLYPEE